MGRLSQVLIQPWQSQQLLSSSPYLLLPPWELLISLCTLVLPMVTIMYLLGTTIMYLQGTTIINSSLATTLWDMSSLGMCSLDTTKYISTSLDMLDMWPLYSGVDRRQKVPKSVNWK